MLDSYGACLWSVFACEVEYIYMTVFMNELLLISCYFIYLFFAAFSKFSVLMHTSWLLCQVFLKKKKCVHHLNASVWKTLSGHSEQGIWFSKTTLIYIGHFSTIAFFLFTSIHLSITTYSFRI